MVNFGKEQYKMNSITFGYCRVSTRDQYEGRQVEQMKAEGVDERNIYIEKKSGKDFNREQYNNLLGSSAPFKNFFEIPIDF